MRLFVIISIALYLLSGISMAQSVNRSRVMELFPKQPQLQAKIDRQIALLTEEEAIMDAIYPQVAGRKLYLAIFVYKGPGKHGDLIFNPCNGKPGANGQMVFESKGGAVTRISRAEDFGDLPDTLALLDTLKFRVNFNSAEFPLDGYYARWKRSGKEVRLHPDLSRLIPLTVAAGNYESVELRNTGADAQILYRGKVYALTAKQRTELKAVISAFISADISYTLQEVITLTRRYLSVRYGKPLDEQVSHWVMVNFRQLQP